MSIGAELKKYIVQTHSSKNCRGFNWGELKPPNPLSGNASADW